MNLFLIILAAGNSKRFKSNIPKPYQIINNKTILEHSIAAFANIKEIKKTIVVYNKKHAKYLKKINLKNVLKIVGGKTRQGSTLNALKIIKKMNCKKVLIHDSARPNPQQLLIKKIILNLKKNHAVIPITSVNDATKRIKKNIIFKNIERNTLRFAQTPQGFTFNKIYKKHVENINLSLDDDSSLFIENKEKVIAIKGSKNNLKITDIEDLQTFKSLMFRQLYYGIGFDIHKLTHNRKFFLGGIKIKSKIGTLGHSDGDPVLHAIIDSILGACRLGDIGEKFSDNDKKYKNIRSTILLKQVIEEIKVKGYFINNLDINIITQTPKVKKYKNKMIEIISKICEISKNQINIKGKTTEKLGIIGKEKAIACEVITSVVKYD